MLVAKEQAGQPNERLHPTGAVRTPWWREVVARGRW